MRRIIWMGIIAAIVVTWGLYTWVPPVRAAMDGFVVNVVIPTFGGAFTSMYIAIVTSPFWQTWVAPWAWLISGCIFSIATMIVFWKAPIIKRKAPVIKKDLNVQREPAEPEPSPKPKIEKTETTPAETPIAATTEKQESG